MTKIDFDALISWANWYVGSIPHSATHQLRDLERALRLARAASGTNAGQLVKDWKATQSAKIISYRDLAHDWDHDGGLPPADGAIRDALAFLNALPSIRSEPRLYLAGDGEIGFSWVSGSDYIDVGFYGDGHIHYYARVGAAGINRPESGPFDRQRHLTGLIPEDLRKAIIEI
jgi:hypothetical protein